MLEAIAESWCQIRDTNHTEMNTTLSALKALLITIGLAGVFALTSCNTVSGMGRDIQNAGHSLKNAADR